MILLWWLIDALLVVIGVLVAIQGDWLSFATVWILLVIIHWLRREKVL